MGITDVLLLALNTKADREPGHRIHWTVAARPKRVMGARQGAPVRCMALGQSCGLRQAVNWGITYDPPCCSTRALLARNPISYFLCFPTWLPIIRQRHILTWKNTSSSKREEHGDRLVSGTLRTRPWRLNHTPWRVYPGFWMGFTPSSPDVTTSSVHDSHERYKAPRVYGFYEGSEWHRTRVIGTTRN